MSGGDVKGFYAILGLKPNASSEQIKAAYRDSAKKLHPDINKASDAALSFRLVAEAYAVLGDPDKRAHYDADTLASSPKKESQGRSVVTPICCSSCRCITAQPRYLLFWCATSFIIASYKTPVQGVFCAQCARRISLKQTAISATAGWWGFPWGPIFTLSAIVTNVQGGKRFPGIDDRLTWQNTAFFALNGKPGLSFSIAETLLKSKNEEIAKSAQNLREVLIQEGVAPNTAGLKNAWETRPFNIIAQFALLLSVPIIVFTILSIDGSREIKKIERPTFNFAPISTIDQDFSGISNTRPPATCKRPVLTGAVIQSDHDFLVGDHTITIQNGNTRDAIVKIRSSYADKSIRTVFIAGNTNVDIDSIADGFYQIQYAIGDNLAEDCLSLIGNVRYGRFPGLEQFRSTDAAGRRIRQRLTLTLHAQYGGNVHPQPITAFDFDK